MADWLEEVRKLVAPEIVIGTGTRSLVGRYARNLGARKVLVVTDPGLVATGWPDDVVKSLEREDLAVVVFDRVTSNPRSAEVAAGAELYRLEGCDLIASVGGGSPTDCAKGIGIAASNARDILELEGIDNIRLPMPPLVCVPTTCSGADVSQYAIVTDLERHRKVAIVSKAIVPDVTLVDPELLTTLSSSLAVASGIDALSHGLEAFLSNASAEITDVLALHAVRLLWAFLPRSLTEPSDLAVRRQVAIGATCAGLAFSNAGLGVLHALSHGIAGVDDGLHGKYVAPLLPRVLDFNFEAVPAGKMSQLRAALGLEEVDTSSAKRQLVEAIERFVRDLGASAELSLAALSEAEAEVVVWHVMTDPCLATNPRTVARADIEQLLGLPRRVAPALEVSQDEVRRLRDRIVGLGERSMRKSYYPSLLQRIDELQRAKDAAERASRMKTEFLNVASHELRTPLTSLQLLIPLVAQRLDVPALGKTLDRMERQVARLATMVNDMLDVARLERGAVTLHRAPTEIGELVRDAIETFRLQFPARPISLAAPDRSITVHCDRIRIEQVLDNLLDNAAKYSPDDRPIGVAIAVENADVRISVRDEGLGLPTEELGSLFTPLFRTSRSTALHKQGLGLGLYISSEIVRLHGGRIGVTANPDAGSTFFFYLPAAAPRRSPNAVPR